MTNLDTLRKEGFDRSGITVAGAKDVAPKSGIRQGLTFQNTSNVAMRVSENSNPATSTTGYFVGPGRDFNASTAQRISVYCAEADKTFASVEF